MIDFLVQRGFFRNANHAIWFFLSVGFFILTLLWAFVLFSPKFIFLLIGAHLMPLVTASLAVKSGKKSELYTRDCIWFNALMIVVYLVFLLTY